MYFEPNGIFLSLDQVAAALIPDITTGHKLLGCLCNSAPNLSTCRVYSTVHRYALWVLLIKAGEGTQHHLLRKISKVGRDL
jgi:hypothetical protein